MIYRILAALWLLLPPSISLGSDGPEPLVLYHIGDVPVELREGDPCGIMLINDGTEEAPKPRYIVAIADGRTLLDTTDLDLFGAILETLPPGTEVYRYGSCSKPRSWGLTKEQFATYEGVLAEHEIIPAEKPRITCYCGKEPPPTPSLRLRAEQPGTP